MRLQLFSISTNVMTAVMVLAGVTTVSTASIIAGHNAVIQFEEVPLTRIEILQSHYQIFYGHTSHGSQLLTGLDMIETEDPLYYEPDITEVIDDLGESGDVSWVQPTRDFLNANPDCDVVMWSWCGGVSTSTEEDINTYLDAMDQLEADYPDVIFIYMTGHLDGTGVEGNLYQRNNQIRDYCQVNDKVLYDFSDIESYDPDGNFYPDGSDVCEWCESWCAAHTCPTCDVCAHSHCFNCYQKGKAFWWIMARISGWVAAIGVEGDAEAPVYPGFELKQNHPNPFNPVTTIEYTLTTRAEVSVAVYNVMGDRIKTLIHGVRPAGLHRVNWDGTDSDNKAVGSGVYVYRMKAGEFETTRKMVLLK